MIVRFAKNVLSAVALIFAKSASMKIHKLQKDIFANRNEDKEEIREADNYPREMQIWRQSYKCIMS